MEILKDFFFNLWQLTLEMAPWLLLGFLFAGIQKVFFPQAKIQQHIGKNNWLAVLKATLLGIPLPLCSCGVIPTGISLYKNGASKGATNAFFIATPQTGIDSVFATYALVGLPFAILRPLIALISGFFGGIATNFTTKHNTEPPTLHTQKDAKKLTPTEKIKIIFRYGFVTMMDDLVKWLIIGLVLAAIITTALPDGFFQNYIHNPWLEILVVLAISVPLYVCATGSIPIAAALLLKGISPGAALLFLMAGPATNVATMTVLGKTMGKKSLAAYLFSIITGGTVFAILINQFVSREWMLSSIVIDGNHEHHLFPMEIQYALGILLLLLMGWALYKKAFPTKLTTITNENAMKLTVKGMTCNHCKASVERNVGQIEGVEQVTVDLQGESVAVEGNTTKGAIKEVITNIGFEVVE